MQLPAALICQLDNIIPQFIQLHLSHLQRSQSKWPQEYPCCHFSVKSRKLNRTRLFCLSSSGHPRLQGHVSALVKKSPNQFLCFQINTHFPSLPFMKCTFNPCLSCGWVPRGPSYNTSGLKLRGNIQYAVHSVCLHSSCICPSFSFKPTYASRTAFCRRVQALGKMQGWKFPRVSLSIVHNSSLLWCQPTIKSAPSVWTKTNNLSPLAFHRLCNLKMWASKPDTEPCFRQVLCS